MTDNNHQNKAHISIALTNPKSPTNVGAVMRAAGCYQADQVLYTGRRYEQAAKYNKDTLKTDTKNMQDKIPLLAVDDFITIKDLVESIPASAKIICVDLVEGATPLPHFVHPEQAVYIFGPEDGTIKQQVIDCADEVVYVPTVGCMNLAASVNVLLYDRIAKSIVAKKPGELTSTSLSSSQLADNGLIRRSRDTNNTVKVKQR